jgi:hypothetical protein
MRATSARGSAIVPRLERTRDVAREVPAPRQEPPRVGVAGSRSVASSANRAAHPASPRRAEAQARKLAQRRGG